MDNLVFHKDKIAEDKMTIMNMNMKCFPKNTTSHCKPLDVDVMGLLKQKLVSRIIIEGVLTANFSEMWFIIVCWTYKVIENITTKCISQALEQSKYRKITQ